jgi:hypothetical protein
VARTAKAVFRARSSFVATVAGRTVTVAAGQLVQEGDPLLTGRGALFDPVSDYVEQATAAPGEKRTTSRPAAVRSKPADAERD